MDHTKTEGEKKDFTNKAEGFHEISPQCAEVCIIYIMIVFDWRPVYLYHGYWKVFEALKIRRKHRYIIFKIGVNEIEIEKIGARNEVYLKI